VTSFGDELYYYYYLQLIPALPYPRRLCCVQGGASACFPVAAKPALMFLGVNVLFLTGLYREDEIVLADYI
jgi:hypothetical protein